jgi:hypothetical protein
MHTYICAYILTRVVTLLVSSNVSEIGAKTHYVNDRPEDLRDLYYGLVLVVSLKTCVTREP